jgi:hypothetical protein
MRVSPARLFDRRLRVPRRTMSDNRSVAPRPPAIDAQSPTLRLRRCEHRELAVFHVKHGDERRPVGRSMQTPHKRRTTRATTGDGSSPSIHDVLGPESEGSWQSWGTAIPPGISPVVSRRRGPLGAKLVRLAGPGVLMRHCGLTAGEAAHAVPAQCPHRRHDFVRLRYSAGWSEIAPHRTIGSFAEGACDGDASVDEGLIQESLVSTPTSSSRRSRMRGRHPT